MATILGSRTDPRWVTIAVEGFDRVLVDHAHCEKKAAASAMALVSAYPDDALLVGRMVRLATEELRHFRQVHDRIVARGLTLGRDEGDPYAKALLALQRSGARERKIDRLLVSALIEARSCERLELLAGALPDEGLRAFYAALARSEGGHERLFLELAARDDADDVARRLPELVAAEAKLVAELPLLPRVH